MCQRCLLCICQITEQRTCCNDSAAKIYHAQSFQRSHMKMLPKCIFTQFIIKIPVFQRIQYQIQPFLQIIQFQSAHKKCFIADHFPRRKLIDLIHELSGRINLRYKIITGRHIRKGNAVPVTDIDNAHYIIVLGFIQCLCVQVGSRCDNSDNFPLYQPFCQCRVFHLFTDRHFIAF